MKSPKIIFSVTKFREIWYFGILTKNDLTWMRRIEKPFSYSNSLDVKTSKVVVNLAVGLNRAERVIDTCAGVGTIVVEGLANGIDIQGMEINSIIAENARENLKYCGFSDKISTGNMLDIQEKFYASILDIPYGVFSHITLEEQQQLINKCYEISNRLILITMEEELSHCVEKSGFKIIDKCTIPKGKFKRTIYICERR